MPRIPRMYFKTEYFHVIVQGINKSYIFDDSIDIKYYIKNMYELQNKYNIKIIAYCIMNNHAHILLKTKIIKSMSEFMHSLNTSYACYYNKKYKKIGYVFRDRYKAEGIYSESHIYNCINYIYNNPVKAGICDKPKNYPYSNYKNIESKGLEYDYVFMDVMENSDEVCAMVVKKILKENNCNMEQLKKDKKNLQRLIVTLKRDYNISLRDIAINLNINRESVRKIYNKK